MKLEKKKKPLIWQIGDCNDLSKRGIGKVMIMESSHGSLEKWKCSKQYISEKFL